MRLPDEPEFRNAEAVRQTVPTYTETMFVSAGGGGWGDPLERETDRVQWDVIEEYVSLQAAHDEYGVVLNPETMQIDTEATADLRDELRRQRK